MAQLHVLVYHGPLLSHLLGVAPSTFTTLYLHFVDFYGKLVGQYSSPMDPRGQNPERL